MINRDNIKDIKNINYITDHDNIYINNDSFFFTNQCLKNYQKDPEKFIHNVRFYFIIKNKVHILQAISKIKSKETIFYNIPDYIKSTIVKKIFNITPIITDNEYIDNIKSKYYYIGDRITLNKNSIGYYIVNILYKKYFDLISTDNEEEFDLIKKTFLLNLKNISNIDINYNKILNLKINKELLLNLMKYLNPIYIQIS